MTCVPWRCESRFCFAVMPELKRDSLGWLLDQPLSHSHASVHRRLKRTRWSTNCALALFSRSARSASKSIFSSPRFRGRAQRAAGGRAAVVVVVAARGGLHTPRRRPQLRAPLQRAQAALAAVCLVVRVVRAAARRRDAREQVVVLLGLALAHRAPLEPRLRLLGRLGRRLGLALADGRDQLDRKVGRARARLGQVGELRALELRERLDAVLVAVHGLDRRRDLLVAHLVAVLVALLHQREPHHERALRHLAVVVPALGRGAVEPAVEPVARGRRRRGRERRVVPAPAPSASPPRALAGAGRLVLVVVVGGRSRRCA